MEKIIGADGHFLQTVKKITHDVRGIVDAFEQNRLVGDGNARLLQHITGPRRLRCNFRGVIELRIEPQGPVSFEHPAERPGDAHWQNNRPAAADTQNVNMRDGFQRSKDFFENTVIQGQGIAAGNNHFPDAGRFGNVTRYLLQTVSQVQGSGAGPERFRLQCRQYTAQVSVTIARQRSG